MSKVRSLGKVCPLFLGLAIAGCGGDQAPATTAAASAAISPGAAKLDLLFMVDDSSSMTTAQQKLLQEMQSFAAALDGLPGGLPDLHVAVVSSDMGAPGDETTSIGCTPNGDAGQFQFAPRGDCTSAGLAPGATFISNSGGVPNYTGSLADVLSCIAPLGSMGCGFENQLGSVARALGVDGRGPPPATNSGFLRPDAELAIILLTNEDDCSAPPDTKLYSLDGGQQSISNPLGPIANYRCNQFGHLCKDPSSSRPDALVPPPLRPSTGSGDSPTLTMTECVSDDGCDGLLTPVQTFVSGIKALKDDPSQIVVGAIVAPPDPYTISWVPPFSPTPGIAGELWPQIMHSCGPTGLDDLNPAAQISADDSFGDPAVRIAQWVRAFGDNGFVSSICDSTYVTPMQQFAALIAAHLQPSGTPPAPSTPSGTGPLANSPECHRPQPRATHGLNEPGCSTSGGTPSAASLLLVAAGLVLVRRRRR